MTFLRTAARLLGLLKSQISTWKKRPLGKTKIAVAALGLILVATLVLPGLAFGQGKTSKPASAQSKAPAATVASPTSFVPIIRHAVGFAETKPLRELAAAIGPSDLELTKEAEEINELNTDGPFGTPNPNAPIQKDGALQFSWGKIPSGSTPNIPTPILTFEGIPVQSGAPPDTTGAVGPNHYVEGVNTIFRVYDKTGVPLAPAFKLSKLFAALGGVVASTDNGDPIVIYDRMADRWLLSQFAFTSTSTPPYHEAIAISKTGDPLGPYWVYDFIVPGNDFPDYSKFGAWPDGYYMTDRQFTLGAAYNGFGCFAFDRA
ncbi:MAG TPA: hypothetical protein VK581_04085, partial [Chthoniobacterales bacterium]|nr:hypothetical protein [Chthoniobacterales bacterium]